MYNQIVKKTYFFAVVLFFVGLTAFPSACLARDGENQTPCNTNKASVHPLSNTNLEVNISKLKKFLFLEKQLELPWCFSEMAKRLTAEEAHLLKLRPKIFLSIIDCKSSTYYIEIAVHEAIHLMDLNVTLANINSLNAFSKEPFLLYLAPYKSIEIPKINLPKPIDIVAPYIKKSYPSLIQNQDTDFYSFYGDYILDRGTLSVESFEHGFSTELNAYIHGLKSENRQKVMNKGSNDYYDKVLGQRHGLIFFLTVYNVYLSQLKEQSPLDYKKLKNNKKISAAINSMFTQASKVLKVSDRNHQLSQGETDLRIIYRQLKQDAVMEDFVNSTILEELNSTILKKGS